MNWPSNASSGGDQAKVKRRRHRKPGKDIVYRCLVCDDVALNYNFTVITCESCKAFFRRNVDTPNRFHCPNHFSCKVTKQTRKHCPACRLKKCFDVGMRKELPPGPGAPGSSNAVGGGAYDDSRSEQDMKGMIPLPNGLPPQYVEAMNRAAAYANYGGPNSAEMQQQLNLLASAASTSPAANMQLIAMMSAAGAFPNMSGASPGGDWRVEAVRRTSGSNAARTQLDNVAVQLGGVALNNSGGSPLVSMSTLNALRTSASTCSFDGASSTTGHDTPCRSANMNLSALNSGNASSSDTALACRVDPEPVSPVGLSSPAPSACTLPLHSPFGAFAEQTSSSQSQCAAMSNLPLKHRLKRLRSPSNSKRLAAGLYESPASNISSGSSGEGGGTLVFGSVSAKSRSSGPQSVLLTNPANSCASPSQSSDVTGGLMSAIGSVASASSMLSPSRTDDSPTSSSIVFDRDGICASTSALLSADEFKQALETCTRFSTMMQAPFSTSELGTLLSNPLPENAFESSVYAEMALRRYVHSLKRLDDFSHLDRCWQLFVLRRALITAHSVNVGFYTDVERRAFICPREDGSCLYLNEAYFYRTFDKVRSGALDFGTLMKPLMGFHVALQLQFSTQWTIVLAAMSLIVLFSTHYYVPPAGSSSGTTATSPVSQPGNGHERRAKAASHAQPSLSTIIQQFAKMAGVKLPPNMDLGKLDLASLSHLCPGVDLQALAASFKQLADPSSTGADEPEESQLSSGNNDAFTGAMGGLDVFGPSAAPSGLVDSIEPLHRKYLYFLHDYVLLLHANTDRAMTAWRFCNDKLEEVRRVADVFTQQAFLFIAQNPQLGGMLIPLMNEIISSTPP